VKRVRPMPHIGLLLSSPDPLNSRKSHTEIEELKEASLRVDQGELSAMAVALQTGFPILMDDRRARQAAEDLGISTFGTLAVLEIAANKGWLYFKDAEHRLPTIAETKAIICQRSERKQWKVCSSRMASEWNGSSPTGRILNLSPDDAAATELGRYREVRVFLIPHPHQEGSAVTSDE
ncbi:MAG: hypothetical protein KDN22_18140, partial [Verrucomicrobiae bacterium]|nr:hypothetical protein [Verrucomicrobiae bacterium]